MRLVISRSLWRKLAVTSLAVVAFVLLYETSMFDSRDAAPQGPVDPTLPAAGSRLLFTSTAYCKGDTTSSGVGVRTGIAASDPTLLPVGSVVNVSTDDAKYNGVYTIMDTGPRVQGRSLDLYMQNCRDALAFGRRSVEVTVLRLGWNPSASSPSLIDRLFRRREAARRTASPPPPAPAPVGVNGGDTATSAASPAEGESLTQGAAERPALAPTEAPDAPVTPATPVAPAAPTSNAP